MNDLKRNPPQNFPTPPDLRSAINNALLQLLDDHAPMLFDNDIRVIEEHVRDFLAQRFCSAMFHGHTLMQLWKDLFPYESDGGNPLG